MKAGCVREIKNNEFRVGPRPNGAKQYRGHEVYIEKGAGLGAEFCDADYVKCGADGGGERTGRLGRVRHGDQGEGAA